jgi:hypothetical protein
MAVTTSANQKRVAPDWVSVAGIPFRAESAVRDSLNSFYTQSAFK